MKTRYWIALLTVILIICITLSIPLLLSGNAVRAEIISDGQVLQIVDLKNDGEFHISTEKGSTNTVTVKDGKIGVTQASCPDHYCMERGMCSGGTQIVCLPNKLIIRFQGAQTVDSVAG